MEFLEENKVADSHLVLLLQLIYAGADVGALLRRGLEFSQIAQLINEAIAGQLAEETNKGLILTDAGVDKLRSGASDDIIRRNGNWISPLDEFRIDKIDLTDVFLPNLGSVYNIARSLALRGKPRE